MGVPKFATGLSISKIIFSPVLKRYDDLSTYYNLTSWPQSYHFLITHTIDVGTEPSIMAMCEDKTSIYMGFQNQFCPTQTLASL